MSGTLRNDPQTQWLEQALRFRERRDRDVKRFKFRTWSRCESRLPAANQALIETPRQ